MTECKWLYVIEHPDGYVKIGKASDPMARFYSIQSGSPYELTVRLLVKYIPQEYPLDEKSIEAQAHEAFESERVRGEWFDISYDRVLHFLARRYRTDTSLIRLFSVKRERERKQENERLHVQYRGPL